MVMHSEPRTFRPRFSMTRRGFIRAGAIAAVAPMAIRDTSTRSLAVAQDFASDVELRLPFNPFGETVDLHPHRAPNWGPFWVTMPYIWSGLLRFDEMGAVEPDLAERVEPNEDGSVWTATLREGVTFANGDPVTADMFVTSWTAALNPSSLSPMSSYMRDLAGYEDTSRGATSDLGVEAVDDRTLTIRLGAPNADFPARLATFVFAVVHPDYLANPAGNVGLDGASAGPWRLTDQSSSAFTLESHTGYWAAPSPSITRIVWDIAPGGGTDQFILDGYTSGQYAIADVPPTLAATVANDPELSTELIDIPDHASTMTIALDFHQAPFNDPRVRQAVAHAIDREAWATEIQKGAYVAATSFTPPVLAQLANYTAPQGPAFDASSAQSLMDMTGILDSDSVPDVTCFQPATDSPEQMEQVRLLLEMISTNTGLTINQDTSLTREQITALRQDQGGLQIELMQWWLDSTTPSILDVASQASPYNAGYVNWEPRLEAIEEYTPGSDAATFDDLVTSARSMMDEADRNRAYADAEALLLSNCVYIPLGYWKQRFLQKPWLLGTRQGPWSGSTPVRIDAEVSVSPDYQSATN